MAAPEAAIHQRPRLRAQQALWLPAARRPDPAAPPDGPVDPRPGAQGPNPPALLVIVVAAAVIRWLPGDRVGSHPFLAGKRRALEILEERFAKGEIDKDEFQEKKRLLAD